MSSNLTNAEVAKLDFLSSFLFGWFWAILSYVTIKKTQFRHKRLLQCFVDGQKSKFI